MISISTAGCVGELPEHPGFGDESFLCSEAFEDDFAERIQTCDDERARGIDCGGVISFKGQIEGTEVVVDSFSTSTRFTHAKTGDDDDVYLDQMRMVGDSLYFLFSFKLTSVGGSTAAMDETSRTLQWDNEADDVEPFETGALDDRVRGDLRIENGLDSKEFPSVNDVGDLTISYQDADTVTGRFSAAFGGADNKLDGCFHALVTEVLVESR